MWKEITWPPGLLERQNNNKVVSFSALFFYVYTNVDNRERAREKTKETNFVGRKTWKFKAVVRK